MSLGTMKGVPHSQMRIRRAVARRAGYRRGLFFLPATQSACVLALMFLLSPLCAARLAATDGMQFILSNPRNSAPRVISLWGGAGSEQIILKSDGTVWAWGWNSFGQQGDGTTNNTCMPHQALGPGGIGLLTNVTAIMGGETHNAALRADGTVWEWGRSLFGELGDGSSNWGAFASMSTIPVQVIGLTSVIRLGGRGYHDLAERSDGTVWAWGDNQSGELGNGLFFYGTNRPVQVIGLTNPVVITGGGFYSAALMADGTVRTWGNNSYGQCGDGTTSNHSTCIQVPGLSNVVSLSGGWTHVLAVKSDGTAWTWGDNGLGELGNGASQTQQLTPVQVAGLSNVVAVSGGDYSSLARLADGTIWTWGNNAYGQLGLGYADNAAHPLPVQVPGVSNVVLSAARDYHCICVKRDGTVWVWGDNRWGGGGDLSGSNVVSPRLMTGLVGNNIVPYADSFESYASGSSVVGSNSWSGASATAAVATATNYASSYSGTYPTPGPHNSALSINGTVTNSFCPSFHTNVWVDVMLQAAKPSNAVPALTNASFALCVTTNGRLAVWNCTNPPAADNGWTELQDVSLGTNAFFRATIGADYAPDANGVFYFSIWINGIASTHPAARYASADASQPWFGQIVANGNFLMDDLVVATNKPFYALTAAITGYGGSISPPGPVIVTPGSTSMFYLTASKWYHLVSVMVDGTNVGIPTSYTFTNVAADHTIMANYAADLAAHDTPKWWLYQMNPSWSTNFDAAALGDQDGDGVPTWQEYIAGTDPMNASSALALTIGLAKGQVVVTLPTIPTSVQYEAQRYYALEMTTNLASPTRWTIVPGWTNILASGQPVVLTNSLSGPNLFFRAGAWLE
jgi:alpha-tubulin suppressor-like RCC1 family protein